MTLSSERVKTAPVLVIGGRGFVGAHVTAALIAAGRRPHLFGPAMQDDLLADYAGRFDESLGSITDRAALRAVIMESGAQEIVSMAAHSAGRVGLMRSGEDETDQTLAINFGGMQALSEIAVETSVRRLVWTSSTVVYGNRADYGSDPVDEDAPSAPRTFYGLSKQLAEAAAAFHARRDGLSVTALRLPLVLGPKLWYAGAASAILAAARAAATGTPHRVSFHDDPMDLMHVTDTAQAMLACLDHEGPLRDRYNINGFRARFSDILAALTTRFPDWKADFTPIHATLDFPAISDARFRRDCGFAPAHDLDATIDSLLLQETP